MNIQIKKYNPVDHEGKLIEMIAREGEEWAEYVSDEYKACMRQSTSYVALADGVLCGYSRSLVDFGFYVWVLDLLVDKAYRGYSIGKRLLDRVVADFPDRDIYVLSDVDDYYQKLGLEKEGSVFKIK